MTIQQMIDEVVKAVETACRYIPEEERENVLNDVKDIGYQWQSANVTGRVMGIAAGLIARGITIHDVGEDVDLTDMENIGTKAIFDAIPLPIYSWLHTEMLTEAIGGMEE